MIKFISGSSLLAVLVSAAVAILNSCPLAGDDVAGGCAETGSSDCRAGECYITQVRFTFRVSLESSFPAAEEMICLGCAATAGCYLGSHLSPERRWTDPELSPSLSKYQLEMAKQPLVNFFRSQMCYTSGHLLI